MRLIYPTKQYMSTCNSSELSKQGVWITQTEAAALRKVTTATIACLLRSKRLRSKMVAGRKLVHMEDVTNFKPLVTGVGRPSRSAKQTAMALINCEEWITQKEAAKLRQITVSGIQTAIKRGRIRVLRKNGIPFVNKQDVLNYRPRIDFHPESGLQNALPPGENPEDWITVAEAARIRSINQATITRHITRKRIRSIKTGDTRLVYREDIINFKAKPRPGRPKKK